jgi:hypothetical protein
MKNKILKLCSGILLIFILFSCNNENNIMCEETVWYEDADGDGLGNPDVFKEACEQPTGFVANNDDNDDSSVNAGETIELGCNSLNETQTLKNGANDVDYIVSCGITINADITVEEGTVIAFEEGTWLTISSGSLKAKGTPEDPIIFRGVNEVTGFWYGIYYESNTLENELEHVTIKDAGFAEDDASLELREGRLKLSNLRIENGASNGFRLYDGARLSTFNNIQITSHEGSPIVTTIDQVGALNNEGCDFSGNELDYIYISGNQIDEAVDFRKQSVPYYLSNKGEINVNDEINIDPGVDFIMASNAGIYVRETGVLKADGQATDNITIKGEIEQSGYWRGIRIESNNAQNSLNHVEIQHTGSNRVGISGRASLVLADGQASVKNLTITNGAENGIRIWEGFDLVEYSNIQISSHEKHPIFCDLVNVSDLDGLGSDYTGNTVNAILLRSGGSSSTITKQVTMPKNNIPYQLKGRYNIQSLLTIEPGCTLNFESDGALLIQGGGALNASSNASDPIVFQGTNQGVSNFWRGIAYTTNSLDNKLEHFIVDGAGSGRVAQNWGDNAVLVRNGARIEIKNGLIKNIDGCGIAYTDDVNITIEDMEYQNVTDPECEK